MTLAAVHLRPQPGIAISKERLNADQVIALHGVLLTMPLRSTLFEMRYAESLWSAVVVADMAAFNDLVAIDELWAYALAHSGMTGIPQGRDATLLADENSWSPMETIMRLIWTILAGLPRPLTNQPSSTSKVGTSAPRTCSTSSRGCTASTTRRTTSTAPAGSRTCVGRTRSRGSGWNQW